MTESNKGKTLRLFVTRDPRLGDVVYYKAFYKKNGKTYMKKKVCCKSIEKDDFIKCLERLKKEMGKGHLKDYSKLSIDHDWENVGI